MNKAFLKNPKQWILLGVFFATGFVWSTVADAYTATRTVNHTTVGQTMTFDFTGLQYAAGNISVIVSLNGDYNSSSEYADVTIDGANQAQHNPSGGPNCPPKPE